MRRIRFKFGETVLREGSRCRDMFLVEAGTLRIAGKDLIVCPAPPGLIWAGPHQDPGDWAGLLLWREKRLV